MSFSSLYERIGAPQLIALVLLLIFALQCVWFIAHEPLSALEGVHIEAGLLQLEGYASANSTQRTALVPLMAGIPARISGAEKHVDEFNDYRMAIRLPFMIVGILLGASLWYVARRLYGDIGGYVALGLYCFSPLTIGCASEVGPAVVGAWGAFGLIFTSIAVAHTLYAPREVVLWNWRRILLMGLSIAICVGAQFSFWMVLLPALLFMLWVGHVRPGAVVVIFAAACIIALILLSAFYGFRIRHLRQGAGPRRLAGDRLARLLLRRDVVAAEDGFSGKRVRAPHPHARYGRDLYCLEADTVFWNCRAVAREPAAVQHGPAHALLRIHVLPGLALPFLILFMAGVSADLLESRYALLANAVVFGVLIANAMIDVYGLMNISSRSH